MTLDRLIKYGGTPGCKACKGEAVLHTPVCKVRFDGLIRADKAAEARSKSAPPTPATLPPTPGLLDPAPVSSPPHSPRTGPVSEPSSSGRAPAGDVVGEPGAAAINQELFEPDSAFLERDRLRRRACSRNESRMIEYCCDDDSEISNVCSTYGIGFLRLGLTTVDLSNPQHVEQAKGQIQAGDSIWMSLPCTEHSSWQFMNIQRHGAAYEEKLKKRRAKIRKMMKLATAVAEEKIAQGCSVTFEWPKESLLWQDPVFLAFEKKMNMRRVTFHGCALGLMGLKDPIKKPWCVSTTSLRMLQLFGQRQCDKSHSHEPAEGSKTKATGHYNNQFAQLVVEALFPWRYYRSVPSFEKRMGSRPCRQKPQAFDQIPLGTTIQFVCLPSFGKSAVRQVVKYRSRNC